MAKSSISILDNKKAYEEFEKRISDIENSGVYSEIGIFADAVSSDGRNIVEYATTNEFGDDSQNIPERPFVRSAIDLHEKDIVKHIKARARDYAYGKIDDPIKAIEKSGKYVVKKMKENIDRDEFVENAPYTIRKKGFDMPLYDSGDMYNNIVNREGIDKK